MGPDGTHWPSSTPAYTTPASTTISSLGELNAALATARSGDVIEVAPHRWSQPLTVDEGDASWGRNVLVRPPLGRRQSVVVDAEIELDAPHVTLAGFKLNDTWRARSNADRSAYARIVVAGGAAGYIDDTTDFGLYEIVAPSYGVGSDRMQIRASEENRGTVLSGSWLKGKFRKIGAADHSDTLQTFGHSGGEINGLTIKDTVLWTSADKTFQGADIFDLTVRNSYFGECSTNPEQPMAGTECPGYHAIRDGGRGTEMYDVVVSGSIANDHPYDVLVNTKAASLGAPAVTSSGNDIRDGFEQAPPPLPDLDTIWD